MGAKKDNAAKRGCRTNPLPNSITPVPRYPKKLTIYQLAASPFWWVRYYTNGKILRRSTKETDKRKAFEFAKRFYDEINFKKNTGQALTAQTLSNFGVCSEAMIKAQAVRMERGEISKISHENDVLRLRKHVQPFFGHMDVKSVNYKSVEDFISSLSSENLAAATLTYYLGLVKKILGYAQKMDVLQSIPQLPRIKKRDSPRGWFTTHEYRRLYTNARHLAGKIFIVKQLETIDEKGEKKNTLYTVKEGLEDTKGGKPLRKITISKELRNVISFMANSFIRPTDLKNMKHKHVIVLDEYSRKALVLNLPKSKEHDQPIWTMPKAVDIYLRQRLETLPKSEEWKILSAAKREQQLSEQFVFMPEEKNREKALKTLQIQFSILVKELNLRHGVLGQERTLYSLRHTCIMYRLMYGIGIDLLTLANNARTSPEMIHRFYARHLTGGHNLEMLQSRRSRKLKESFLQRQLDEVLLALANMTSQLTQKNISASDSFDKPSLTLQKTSLH